MMVIISGLAVDRIFLDSEFVFTTEKTSPNLDKKASEASLDTRLKDLFSHTDKNVSVNFSRSSYVSYMVH